jgi:hypothetical protein
VSAEYLECDSYSSSAAQRRVEWLKFTLTEVSLVDWHPMDSPRFFILTLSLSGKLTSRYFGSSRQLPTVATAGV